MGSYLEFRAIRLIKTGAQDALQASSKTRGASGIVQFDILIFHLLS